LLPPPHDCSRDTAKEEGKKGDWEAQVTQLLSWDSLRELLPVVAHNVAHPDSAVRRATLSILSHFTVPMPEDAPNVRHATALSIYLFCAINN
jgi:hypothetical protein